MGCCGASWWFFCIVCDSQSTCKMASLLLPPSGRPRRCDRDVSCLHHCCMVAWTRGLLMLSSSWPPGDPSSNHPPYTPAGSNLVSLLRDGQEGPEMPTNIHPPVLKVERSDQEQMACMGARTPRQLYPHTHTCACKYPHIKIWTT